MDISQSYLKEALHYEPDTGVFTWRTRPREHFRTASGWRCFNTQLAGIETGSPNHDGYLRTILCGKRFLVHRIAFLYIDGSMPDAKMEVDHINGNKVDNRFVNLRIVDCRTNCRNAFLRKNNKTGQAGVNYIKRLSKWQARISTDSGRVYLGVFEDFRAAVSARKTAEIEHGYSDRHGEPKDLTPVSCTESPTLPEHVPME